MHRFCGLFLLPAVFCLTVAVANAQPTGNQSYVGCPRYHFKNGDIHGAGKCYAIAWSGGQSLMLSVLHVLGPAGGYDHQLRETDLNNLIDYVDILDPGGTFVIETARQSRLTVDVPFELSAASGSGDLVAFQLPNNSRLSALSICATPPAVGTKVAVLSHDSSSTAWVSDRYSGRVVRSESDLLIVNLDQPLTAFSSSGAPIVNEQGQLVGMMVGTQDEARTYITAMPALCIRARLLQESTR